MNTIHRTVLTTACLAAACVAASPAATQEGLGNLRIHGYLTQGFAQSSEEPILGIPTSASGEHRSAALQFRYALSDLDNVVVQLRHREMGTSQLTTSEEDVKLDWAFYQRRLGPVSARVGRVPLPRGIFNEVRVVGNLLPFYRAPFSFYTESFETIDGAVVGYDATAGAFGLEAHAFYGGYDFRIVNSAGDLMDERGRNVFGGQLWLRTPVPGLRVGGGGSQWEMDEYPLNRSVGEVTSTSRSAGLDANFERLQLRAEKQWNAIGPLDYDSHYVQGGLRITDRITLNAQYEAADVTTPVLHPENGQRLPNAANPAGPGGLDPMADWVHSYEYIRDRAIGVNFRLNPNVVLKLEGHEARGYNFDAAADIFGDGLSTRYLIGSVSVAF